ncbi:hypothetical protein NC653_034187 [Populus alba x Populus x berolinensis]|uniref:Uncharacterized protein n=1 Tax=Populus alba x Populus x berolinensis TaxID=444605 RepID=A0AAD6LLX9_9ROSI|nr:hypothetical protein NC653_034187 [Populus alba x Populus x berolinensis]
MYDPSDKDYSFHGFLIVQQHQWRAAQKKAKRKGKSSAGEGEGRAMQGKSRAMVMDWRDGGNAGGRSLSITRERSKGGENPASTKNRGEEATLVNQPIPHHHLSSSSLKVLFANL